jgi:hypothetical protein
MVCALPGDDIAGITGFPQDTRRRVRQTHCATGIW